MFWNQRQASASSSRGSRSSRSSHAGSSRGSAPREIEFQFFIKQTETLYPPWWTREGVIRWYRDLPDDTLWNCYLCGCVLMAVVWEVSQFKGIYLEIIDVFYNISYAIHVFAIGYKIIVELENTDITFWTVMSFLVDLGSFAHYVQNYNPKFKLGCYYARLHRPFRYLWSLNDYNLKGSILGTTLKYCYIFMVLRITWAYLWMYMDLFHAKYYTVKFLQPSTGKMLTEMKSTENPASQFLSAIYIINKMFIPIGPPLYPNNDIERITCLLIMLSGCLVVTGAAVASLSLVISLYMRPEETFRARYRLIMKEMVDTAVPQALREKVETFYMMYWHKQRAVSETQLMPNFPPTLPATINADIYFEAMQKARILRELSYQMLAELAREMDTTHFIPGDAIIKRGSKKCRIIYITYGDIEMLSAEDDSTAILRMTRGTVLTPCGGAVAAALGLSHLAVRASTFCTAHVLSATDLWKVICKHSVTQDHAGPILAAFTDHIERVKRHHIMKIPDEAAYKSSILNFNRNLTALKEMRDKHGNSLLASSDVFLEIAGCYIMRNRLESGLTDQSDEICLRPTFPCILQPSSSLLVAWHSLVATLILIVCVVHPYFLVYTREVPLEFRFFDYIMTAVFVLDHIVHLSTGDNVEEGVPINFSQTSSQQMRSQWFVLDVVGTLPIFEFVGDGHFAGINKLLRLPKLFRVLKDIEEKCVYRGNLVRFISYSLLLLVACYLIAAMQQGFMCFQSGYCLVTNFTHPPFWEQKPLDDETVSARLTFGLYWAISMINFTVHRETWGKENWRNVLYTLAILEICIVLRIFMEAVYSATIMVTTALREEYGNRISMVKSFLIRNEVDPELRKRFITYLELCWYTDKAYKMTHKKHSTIFYDLPKHVFQDIVGRNRSKYILLIPFMKFIKKEELRNISSAANLFYTSPNEILLNTGELTNEMYVIKQGICEIICPVSHKTIAHLTVKNHFGALICLLRLPAYYTIRAVTHVQVLSIPRRSILKALENPQITQTIEYIKTVPEWQAMQVRRVSFLKYEPPPPTPNMMRFKLPRKHEPDSAFLHPFNRLGFLSILRYIFPRFTIRPDGKYLMRYEWFRVVCALCSAQVFPHYTYLVLQWPFLYWVTLLLDLSAWYDIFQRMLVGYFNEDGILVYHPSSTAAHYMKGPFIVDLLGCLSLENLEYPRRMSACPDVTFHPIENFVDRYRVTPARQYLMLNRLLQLYRLPSAMMMLKDYIERRDILMVIKAIPIFMAVLNVLTCMMVFNSVYIYFDTNSQGTLEYFIHPLNDTGGSWLYLFSNAFRFNLTETPFNLHLATYFWVLYECSTTGYGEFNPSNQDIMQILFFGMTSSTMLVTYFSVRIISIRANVNRSLASFQQHMKDINMYMAKEKLDDELKKELRRYYEYNWEKMGGIDYRGVLKLCDQISLRSDAILHIYGPTFAKCPLLANADVSLLRIVGRAVRSVYFLRDMKILELDDMATDMYFVDYGGVEIRIVTGEMSSIQRLPRGSVFGNLERNSGNRVPYNVVATSRLHLLMIKSDAFTSIMDDFPAVKELMVKYRGTEQKMFILGSESQVKMRRTVTQMQPQRSQKSIVKYIYFQEGFIQLYLISICIGCIYLDVYNAGFQDNSLWLVITLYSLDFCFLLKILTQHALPLLVINKNMKKLMLPIRDVYFKREFRYDIASMMPTELISFGVREDDWMWFAWLRLNRMFRIWPCSIGWPVYPSITSLPDMEERSVTVYKCLKRRNENITVNLTLSTVMAVGIWFTLFVHCCTCMWYFIGSVEDAKMPNTSWKYTDDGGSHCDNHYICSLYFVITTFTQNGVGDVMPRKHTEVIYVTILQILSTMVFMVYVGEFSNIIQFQSFRSFSFYSKYLELQEFLHNNRVSKNLVTTVNKYTLHLWRETRGIQVPHFLKSAPLSLRLRVMSVAYLHHITRHHIFEECEPAFLRQLVGRLQLYTYNAGMYVVKESEITNAMYVIHTGKVKETCEEMDSSARVYPAGSYFGILQGLLRNTPYTHSYETMTKSQVLTLQLDDWEHLLKHFPDSRDAIHKHMRQVGDKDMDQSNWPGGAPQPKKSVFEPLSEASGGSHGLPPGEYPEDRYPGTSRHFGRVSEVMEEPDGIPREPTTSSFRRPSRFAWPTDFRHEADEPQPSRRDTITSEKEFHATVEDAPKMGFMAKFASTAKKLMGRVSDTDLLSSTSGTDELLLEEDVEATEALLAQFEQAKKLTEKKKKHRKSLFQDDQEEGTEKHLLTLDIDESKTDQFLQADSEPFMMRPLRIREDEDTTESTGEVLNLGRSKQKTDEKNDTKVVGGTESKEISATKVASDTKSVKDKKVVGAIEDTSDTESESAVSTKSSSEPKKSEASQKIPETQAAKDIMKSEDTKVFEDREDIRKNRDEEKTSSETSEELTHIEGSQQTTGTQAGEKPTDSRPDAEGTAEEILESQAAKKNKTVPTPAAEETLGAQVAEDTLTDQVAEGALAAKTAEETEMGAQVKEAHGIHEQATDILPAVDATGTLHGPDTSDLKPDQDAQTLLDTTDIQNTQSAKNTLITDAELVTKLIATSISNISVSTSRTVSTPTADKQVSEDNAKSSKEVRGVGSFTRHSIIYDPSQKDKTQVGPIESANQAGTDTQPVPSAEISDIEKALESTETKEEGTSTSASKLNRRFVQVRYEEKKEDGEMDVDAKDGSESDEPTGEGEEGDDEKSTSTSTPDSPETKKKGKPYYRRDSD